MWGQRGACPHSPSGLVRVWRARRDPLSASGLGAPRLQAGLGSAPPLSPKAPTALALKSVCRKVAAMSPPLSVGWTRDGV